MSTLEIWQVSINGEVYEADTETLKQWISEGRILPTDKIKKGALNWNDINKVPMFRASFGASAPSAAPPSSNATSYNSYPAPKSIATTKNTFGQATGNATCRNHPSIAADYACRVCGTPFCPTCPKFIANKMAICPLCGDMCDKIGAAKQSENRQNIAAEMGNPNNLDISDFFHAFKYPFEDSGFLKVAFVYALMLIIGNFAFGTVMQISAYVLLFACTAMAIKNLAQGRVNDTFLPDFSSFSPMDFIRPIFLGIGVIAVTMFPLVIWLFYASAVLAKLVGVLLVAAMAPGQFRLDDLTSTLGASVLLGLIMSIGWAFIYYPIAMAIAGYTESFVAVINPIVGLRTISNMGVVYVKAFFFYCLTHVVQLFALIGSFILGIFIGPIALLLLFGMVVFYFNMVNASIFGLALYKCADKLGIEIQG